MVFLDKLKDKKDDFVGKAKDNLRLNKSEKINDSYDMGEEEQYYEQDYSQQDTQYMEPVGDGYDQQEYYEEDYAEYEDDRDYGRRGPSRPNLLTRQDIAQDTRRTEAARVQENDERGVYATRGDEDLSLKEQKENRERRAEQYKDFSDFSSANIPSMRAAAAPRFMNIITPVAYEDCERISASIRQGNITVICFDSLSQALYTRLLDFAFGAASIKGANVDCLRPGLFVFVEGQALTDSELQELKAKGFLK